MRTYKKKVSALLRARGSTLRMLVREEVPPYEATLAAELLQLAEELEAAARQLEGAEVSSMLNA
jgi:hypothetical protein